MINEITCEGNHVGTAVLVASDDKFSWHVTTAAVLEGLPKETMRLGRREFQREYVSHNGCNLAVLRTTVFKATPPSICAAPAKKFPFTSKVHAVRGVKSSTVTIHDCTGQAGHSNQSCQEQFGDQPTAIRLLALTLDNPPRFYSSVRGGPVWDSANNLVGIVEEFEAESQQGWGIPMKSLYHALGTLNPSSSGLWRALTQLTISVVFAGADGELDDWIFPSEEQTGKLPITLGNSLKDFDEHFPCRVIWSKAGSPLQESDVYICILDDRFTEDHVRQVNEVLKRRKDAGKDSLLLCIRFRQGFETQVAFAPPNSVYPAGNRCLVELAKTEGQPVFVRLVSSIESWWKKESWLSKLAPPTLWPDATVFEEFSGKLRRAPHDSLRAKELRFLLKEAETKAVHYVPNREIRRKISALARRQRKLTKLNPNQNLPKVALEQIAHQTLKLYPDQINLQEDPKWVRWVLRAEGLHSLAATGKSSL